MKKLHQKYLNKLLKKFIKYLLDLQGNLEKENIRQL